LLTPLPSITPLDMVTAESIHGHAWIAQLSSPCPAMT
jgi:hypothetical protein